ncbi:class I SAM-dependent methyltransferase [Glaciimonas sp. GG7]
MIKNPPSYLLQVGNADRERLEILSEVYNPGSHAFLQVHLPYSVQTILDIGCGHGQMTHWFAQKVPNGKVVGIDISHAQLAICEATRGEGNGANVEFVQHDIVAAKTAFTPFDVAYCRFLLLHLKNWDSFFENVLASCQPGASIFIEEPAFPFFCYPESPALNRANALSDQLTTQLGLKFDCIDPLWRFIQQLDVEICAVNFSQPALTTPHKKSLLWRSFYQIKDPIQAMQLATENEINEILTDLNALAHDPHCMVGSLRVIQLHLKKR